MAAVNVVSGQTTSGVDAGLLLNHKPVGTDDVYSIGHSSTLTVNSTDGVLANDTDADSDTLSAVLVDNVQDGTLTLNSNGSFTWPHRPQISTGP